MLWGESHRCPCIMVFRLWGAYRSIEYGGSWWLGGEYEDLNRAVLEEAVPWLPRLVEQAQAKEREAGLAEARSLAAKTAARFNNEAAGVVGEF